MAIRHIRLVWVDRSDLGFLKAQAVGGKVDLKNPTGRISVGFPGSVCHLETITSSTSAVKLRPDEQDEGLPFRWRQHVLYSAECHIPEALRTFRQVVPALWLEPYGSRPVCNQFVTNRNLDKAHSQVHDDPKLIER